jgi:Holliday junction resolvasome RuvABC endonuclease subunit
MSKTKRHSRCIGVRAEAEGINWAIVDGSLEEPVLHAYGSDKAPAAYVESERLSWIRQQFLHILDQYNPLGVAVRYPENTALGANKDSARARCRIEGVVLESAASRNLEVTTGALNTISKNLGTPAKENLLSDEFRGLDWQKYKPTVREAIIAAVSILQES